MRDADDPDAARLSVESHQVPRAVSSVLPDWDQVVKLTRSDHLNELRSGDGKEEAWSVFPGGGQLYPLQRGQS